MCRKKRIKFNTLRKLQCKILIYKENILYQVKINPNYDIVELYLIIPNCT